MESGAACPIIRLKGWAAMNRHEFSPQALRISGLTLLCFAIMFGVASFNRARGGESLVAEYTVTETPPRHVKFEKLPSDEAQQAAAWFFKYTGLGQFDRCARLFPEDLQAELNLEQSSRDFEDGCYIKDYVIHSLETLPTVEYADQKPYYDELAGRYGYQEYRIVRVHFSQKWSDKALERAPQWGDGEYARDFAVGKEPGFRGSWKIFGLGMM